MKVATIEALGRFRKFAVAGRRQRAVAAAVAAVALGLSACQTVPSGASKDDAADARVAAVTKRAQARWDLLLKGDVPGAYAFLSPASRAVTSLERYQSRTNPANYRSVKLERASCEAETCRLRWWLTFDHRVMKGVETPVEETWVIENGQPWYVYRE